MLRDLRKCQDAAMMIRRYDIISYEYVIIINAAQNQYNGIVQISTHFGRSVL